MSEAEDIGEAPDIVELPHLEENGLSHIEDDDDFGSFDEASFEEFQAPEPQAERESHAEDRIVFDSDVFDNKESLLLKVDELLDTLFPDFSLEKTPVTRTPDTLLKGEASRRLEVLSETPRLNPPNWIKLRIRHNLLIKLGVPINLDELEAPKSMGNAITHSRDRSVHELEIDWARFDIPEFESLDISAERKLELLEETTAILSRIEEDNLNNTSQLFLEKSLESTLDSKLAQLKENYRQLLELSSVWNHNLKELQYSQEIYESVVQDMVGYSQKLQRNELIEHLQKTGKKGRRTF